MNLRETRPEDRAAIKRISRASFDRVYAFFSIRGSRGGWLQLVAEEDGAVVGFLEGRLFDGQPPIGYVYFVAVDPGRRRQHAARLLVEESLRRFESRGTTRVFAAVPGDNEASMGLFRSLGFQEAPRGAMWRWYRFRSIAVQMSMMIAPHEVLLVRTFADPSPASNQEPPRP
ncbi:MAG TPA: GNAT family N-acetyltransferase [Thermoplasmata archaeon]|nr:GNAT family N-acetyltransferase [Thermoplasmata archaeon]